MNLNVNSLLIIGLGMIGSSIALSSKSKGIKVYGIDLKKSISDKALKKEIVDEIIESIDDIDSNKDRSYNHFCTSKRNIRSNKSIRVFMEYKYNNYRNIKCKKPYKDRKYF